MRSMEDRRYARQQQRNTIGCRDQPNKQQNALRSRSHHHRMSYTSLTKVSPKAKRILKSAETKRSNLTFCAPRDTVLGCARLTHIPQLRTPLLPPIRTLTTRHQQRSTAKKSEAQKVKRRCKPQPHTRSSSGDGINFARSGSRHGAQSVESRDRPCPSVALSSPSR